MFVNSPLSDVIGKILLHVIKVCGVLIVCISIDYSPQYQTYPRKNVFHATNTKKARCTTVNGSN